MFASADPADAFVTIPGIFGQSSRRTSHSPQPQQETIFDAEDVIEDEKANEPTHDGETQSQAPATDAEAGNSRDVISVIPSKRYTVNGGNDLLSPIEVTLAPPAFRLTSTNPDSSTLLLGCVTKRVSMNSPYSHA